MCIRDRGHADDVEYAAEVEASSVVPVLIGGRFVNADKVTDPA